MDFDIFDIVVLPNMTEVANPLPERNSYFHKETDNAQVKIINLLTATPEELNGFKSTVSQKNGKIASLMHPYWEEDLSENPLSFNDPEYRERRDQYMEACITNNVPLVLFEETESMDRLSQRLPQDAKGVVYVIPTQPKVAEPDTNAEDPWSPVVHVLRGTGVKHIVLGGLVLDFDVASPSDENNDLKPYQEKINEEIEDLKRYGEQLARDNGSNPAAFRWLQKNVLPLYCAGTAGKELLKAGFDVSFSSVSAPGFQGLGIK